MMLKRPPWWLDGRTDRQKISSDHMGRQSQSTDRDDAMEATDLLPRSVDEGRLLPGLHPDRPTSGVNEAGLMVTLVDISQIPFATG